MGFFGWSVAREEVLRKRMALLRREENANGDRRRKP